MTATSVEFLRRLALVSSYLRNADANQEMSNMCVVYKTQAACGDFLPEEFVLCDDTPDKLPCVIVRQGRYVDDVCPRCSQSGCLRGFLLMLAMSVCCVLIVHHFGKAWPVVILLVACLDCLDHFNMF